ncbi:hypothetical protein MLD38_035604 [Melastoma candidum]|uniref:Uncharacterized protein n=1 Tax=Melastoma candidum TaxID=119954 RepID=A0ACB9LHB4_9MYRT|nr:hypothetical protein MLD38_035604 [Melastoma candidum]
MGAPPKAAAARTKKPKENHGKGKASGRDGPKVSQASKKNFKPRNKSREVAKQERKQQLLPARLEEDVPDFPRGGGSLLSQREREEIHAEIDKEFETEERVSKKQKGKRFQKRRESNDDDPGSLFGDGITGKLPKFANRISLKNVSPGMKLWGVISEINEKDLVVGLPGGLRGFTRVADAFDHVFDEVKENDINVLASMFSVGQLVSCVVMEVDEDKKERGLRKIWLSLSLSALHKGFTLDAIQEGMVMSAYVKSVEDHGYILHFGLSSFTGFLPKATQRESEVSDLKAGKLVQGVVKNIDKARKLVYLNSNLDMATKTLTKDIKGISMDLLSPGMLVTARVKSTLENGIMLSFLTYFTGTVDLFHLENILSTKSWSDNYPSNKKVNARILFIDPTSRAIGLTLNSHLITNVSPPLLVKVGDIFENAKVVRVEKGSGLLLEIPSSPVFSPAFVSVSDIDDMEAHKLVKKFKAGSHVRLRVVNHRLLEGLAVGVIKDIAFEGAVFTHSEVKPGMMVRAKVVTVDNFGAIVQFPGGIKALCPLSHMSELEVPKVGKKFQVGAELAFRVLGCKSKKITVTHKKTLLKSKHAIISSYADATDGLVTHGWITKIEQHGCFVRFYNGVQGFAPRHEMGLEAGSDPNLMYHVGQGVKCRVIVSNSGAQRITLSFTAKPARISDDDIVKLGSLIPGEVVSFTPRGVVIFVNAKSHSKGTIPFEHLADHHDHAISMKSVLKPGYKFEQLLVLDTEGHNLLLSAKFSLINAAQNLPANTQQLHANSIVHGYICNTIATGCFVRFLGHLTGFCPRKKAIDDQSIELAEAFFVGQSVRSDILDVDNDSGKVKVSLKQSSCFSTDASFIRDYYTTEDKIARLQSSNDNKFSLKWVEEFSIGRVIEGKIQEAKDYGVVVSFLNHNDVFGFIAQHHLGGSSVEVGSTIHAAVLDIAKAERIVDLSLKPELKDKLNNDNSKNHAKKKKRKSETIMDLELGQTITAVVEIVKDNYLVLSIPEFNHTIGYALKYDYNTQKLPRKQYVYGQSVTATVVALPSAETMGRLLMLLKSFADLGDSTSKRAKKKSKPSVGSLVQAEVTEIKPLEIRVKLGNGFHGRIHITELNDDNDTEDPLKDFKVGQTLKSRIVAASDSRNHNKSTQWELSAKPKVVAESYEVEGELNQEEFSPGQHVAGYVYKVENDWVWLSMSRQTRAKLFILDTACEPSEFTEFQRRFSVGKGVSGYVLTYNKEKKLIRMVQRPLAVSSKNNNVTSDVSADSTPHRSSEDIGAYMQEGDIVGGRISKIFPGVGGFLVQVGPSASGRVHYTEITDYLVSDPLSGYHEGQFVKCKVIEITQSVTGTTHIDLSLRQSILGVSGTDSKEIFAKHTSKRLEKIEELHVGMDVQGYVKNITSKGCFVSISRKIDAKVLLSNLSDGFIENPEKQFPVGKLVKGRILSVEPLLKRVEVTLKTSNTGKESKSVTNDLSSLVVGCVVPGNIRRVEPYGLFITIHPSNLVGLCHKSQLSDDHIEDVGSKYKAGEDVKVKILKVDQDRQRISLGMKDSYIHENRKNMETTSDQDEDDELMTENGFQGHNKSFTSPSSGSGIFQDLMIEDDDDEDDAALAQVESRAAVPPLEVALDDLEQNGEDIEVIPEKHLEDAHSADPKSKKEARKKAKQEREKEIRAAEQRLLEKDVPRTPDEFEKLVRSSPNSSFVWIKYMAFMLSVADVEKARSIAERALRTINIREENEKLNVWVAYFNLENTYGNPPEEAVQKVFQRALQYCDPKKVHLALLGVYERNKQHQLANDLLEKISKKFKHSCKAWLRRFQWLLEQHEDGIQPIVNRALLCLPRHKHIKFISQAAILEFKSGIPARGRTMFEGMLREYPKRTDLWSVYLDQEVKLGDAEIIRSLFERAISLSLPLKKIKFLFKKYLAYEKSQGDEERAEYVKRKAMEYAESANES